MPRVWVGEVSWYLFGSRVLGTDDEYSDVDVMLVGPSEADMDATFWRDNIEKLTKQFPIMELFLDVPGKQQLVPLSGGNLLKGDPVVYGFIKHHAKLVTTQHLIRALACWQQQGQRMFTEYAEFEQREIHKYNKLQDLIKEYVSTHRQRRDA